MFSMRKLFLIGFLLFWPTAFLFAETELEAIEEQVIEYELNNGLTLLILSRHEAPVVSFVTCAKVGAADETAKYFGIAHIFEHMAFKGTENVGTTDFEKERAAMAVEDSIFVLLLTERAKGAEADAERLKKLGTDFATAQKKTREYVISNQYGEIIDRAGGVYLNAGTSFDYTAYHCSLPANKIELWMSLESERFLLPVLREFYTETQGPIAEERRSHEDSPGGKLFERFITTAFPPEHPYGHPILGYTEDILTATREEAWEFFKKYYKPANLVVAIVGDVDPEEIIRLAELYWGRVPSGEEPQRVEAPEIPRTGEKRVELELTAQPRLYMGYYRPSVEDKDDLVYDIIAYYLGSGRTSRFHDRLVKKEKLAVQAYATASFPGDRYSNVFFCSVIPALGHTAEECEKIIYEEIEKLKNRSIPQKEFEKIKARVKARVIRSLEHNLGTAYVLISYEATHGDWRGLFTYLERLEGVTPEDVQRIAQKTFIKDNLVVASIIKEEK